MKKDISQKLYDKYPKFDRFMTFIGDNMHYVILIVCIIVMILLIIAGNNYEGTYVSSGLEPDYRQQKYDAFINNIDPMTGCVKCCENEKD